MRALAVLLAVAALAAGGAACSGIGGDSGERPTTRAQTGGGIDPLARASTEPAAAPARSTKTALLSRVALGRHEGHDRVVFEFRNGLPGYRVEYVEPPLHADGSGERIAVAGSAFVLVTMQPASGFDLETGEGKLVYAGPRRIAGAGAGTSVVQEVVRTGDFEAQLAWAVGLDSRVGFRVRELADPARLVVDFRNH